MYPPYPLFYPPLLTITTLLFTSMSPFSFLLDPTTSATPPPSPDSLRSI